MNTTLARFLSIPFLMAALQSAHAQAAELGRINLANQPGVIIRNPVDLEERYGNGIEARVEISSYSWDMGEFSFDELAIAPHLVLSHQVNEWIDLRMGLLAASLTDDSVDVGDGVMMRPDLFVVRPGAGARFWFNRYEAFSLYFDAQLNYYFIDGKDVSISSSTASVSCGGGVAYNFDEGVAVLLGFVLETGLTDADTKFNGVKRDLSLDAAGVGIGVLYSF